MDPVPLASGHSGVHRKLIRPATMIDGCSAISSRHQTEPSPLSRKLRIELILFRSGQILGADASRNLGVVLTYTKETMAARQRSDPHDDQQSRTGVLLVTTFAVSRRPIGRSKLDFGSRDSGSSRGP